MNRLSPAVIFFLCLSVNLAQAQSQSIKKHPAAWQAKKMVRNTLDAAAPMAPVTQGTPELDTPNGAAPDEEIIIGNTLYDLQTNSTVMPRLFHWPDGQLSAVWTQGFQSGGGYPDRGTGYNHFDGNDWSDPPSERLEASLRTGWPAIVGNADGDETVVSHDFGAYVIHQLSRDAGETAWAESSLPSNTPSGVVWPRLAIGGSNGNTLHAIAIAPPEVSAGVVYEGVDGHVLYYRSLDGGDTWDVQDFIIPGLDSTTAKFHGVDSYAIQARGDVVVVAHFAEWSDVMIYKSLDNGDTWTSSVVHEFPLDLYEIDQGYTVDDLPPYDPAQPDSLAILTSDASGAIVIDNNDMVHVFFGLMYLQDEDLTDGGWTYYPATSGMAYWNESFGSDPVRTIADVVDANDDGVFDLASVDEMGEYFTSLTSHPSAGVDAENNIYLTYVGLTEDFIKESATPNSQHCRHLYAIASTDGGETWTEPFDVSNEDIVSEPDLLPFMEVAAPSAAHLVDDQFHIVYQFDFEPGLSVQGDQDPPENNFIGYVALDIANLGVVSSVKNVSPSSFDFSLSPNPASGMVQATFDLSNAAPVSLSVLNAFGHEVQQLNLGKQSTGPFKVRLDLADLSAGLYFVKLRIGDEVATSRMMKN